MLEDTTVAGVELARGTRAIGLSRYADTDGDPEFDPMLARGFELTLDPDAPPVTERFGFTMQPSGLEVRLRERR
jgi:hypothetical protein